MKAFKKILPFLVIILLFIWIKNNISFIINYKNQGSALSGLEKNLRVEQKKNQYLNEKLYYVATDKFVENQAQNKLGMLKDGEYFVIAPTATPQNMPTQILNNEPNWRKWLQLFF